MRGVLLLYFLGSLLTASCSAQSLFASSDPSSRILFIGNSFTMINGGVDQQLKDLAPSVAVTQVAVGGYRLQDHWNSAATLSTIRKEKWNYVVLQEQSQTPVSDQGNFITYAGKLNNEIKLAGAQTILFMTWERPDSVRYGVTTANLAQAYYNAGNQLGVRVAPVGLAFARALQERPDFALYVVDGHPTEAGTYLAACVLYATIFNKSPVGLRSSASNLPDQQREFLQRIAAEIMGF